MRERILRRFLAVSALLLAVVSMSVLPTSAETESLPAVEAAVPNVVAYYFHGNVRCKTCRTIEAYAEEAITQGFPDEMASGRLAWRVVNVDEPENQHFVEDLQLVTRSVVLVETKDGEAVRWQSLDKVWQLVRDKDAFVAYVRDATRQFLGEL
jgi:hypothetical protein